MDYKFFFQNSIAIVTLTGDIGRKDKESLSNCTKEILEKELSSVVIVFKNVNAIETSVFRELTLLQHEIRRKNIDLWIVGMSMSIKVALIDKGVIRTQEIKSSLPEALEAINKAGLRN
jgi:anti-anti-sigma regulatory factor